MSDFRRVTDYFFVAPQITQDDIAQAKLDGFEAIIVNRPDDEMPGQPQSEEIESAAKEAGMTFARVPISGPPSLHDVDATIEALASNSAKTLAYCRSGTRSITLWSLAQAKLGALSDDEIIELANAAGYDLSGLRPGLQSIRDI